MPLAKRFPPSAVPHQAPETEAAVWIMIVILIGSAWFALFSLLHKVA